MADSQGKRAASPVPGRPQDPGRSTPSAGGAGEPPARGQDLGRARAKVAWGWVSEVEKRFNAGGPKKRYGTLASKLPTLLQVSGLGQTLAFLFSKGDGGKADKPEGLLFSQLADHLRDRLRKETKADFMQIVLDLTPAEYRTATREALAVAEWLKRFAEGRLGTEDV